MSTGISRWMRIGLVVITAQILYCTNMSSPQGPPSNNTSSCQVRELFSIGVKINESILKGNPSYILSLFDSEKRIHISEGDIFMTREEIVKDFADRGWFYSATFDSTLLNLLREKEYKMRLEQGEPINKNYKPTFNERSTRDRLLETQGKIRIGVLINPCCAVVYYTGSDSNPETGDVVEGGDWFVCRKGEWKISHWGGLIILAPEDLPENCREPNCHVSWEPKPQG